MNEKTKITNNETARKKKKKNNAVFYSITNLHFHVS